MKRTSGSSVGGILLLLAVVCWLVAFGISIALNFFNFARWPPPTESRVTSELKGDASW
jgi:hypothetical protein